MIRRIVFLTMLWCCAVAPVQAMLVPVESIGQAYNDGWWYPAGSSFLSPGNKGGYASGWVTEQNYEISFFRGFVNAFGEEPGKITFAIYQGSGIYRDGSPIPSANKIFESQSFDLVRDGTDHAYEIPVNLSLPAGEYWTGFHGYANTPTIAMAKGFELESADSVEERFAQSHAPEPATMLLMAGGLAGLIGFRRKATA